MRKTKKYSLQRVIKKKKFLLPKEGLRRSSWKMLATRLERRSVEGRTQRRQKK